MKPNGTLGWAALVAYVWCWDRYGPETLSAAFRRTTSHSVGHPLVIATWTTVTAHLFGLIPEPYDPFKRLFLQRKIR